MRRSDREIKDFGEIVAVLGRCDVCRVAFNDGEYPYIVPLNFGFKAEDKALTLYFHCALEGKKLELLRADPHVCFEADCEHKLISDAERGYCTMNYESVIGYGLAELVEDERERVAALQCLVDKYHPEGFEFNVAAMPRTALIRLTVSSVTGKARKKASAS